MREIKDNMREIKDKRYGKCWVISYATNGKKPLPGISVKTGNGIPDDCFDGEWLRLGEAIRLHKSLGKAILHIQEFVKGETK